MSAPRRSAPPFYVLNGNVDMQQPLTGEPAGQGWARIECASKKAYGCGKSVEAAVQGLTLYVRLGDGPLVTSSQLAIRMSDEAFQTFKSESQESFGAPLEGIRRMYAVGRVLMAEEHLVVAVLNFHREFGRDLSYFLVYDDADASLSLIDYLPEPHKACCASRPVAIRTAAAAGGGGACCELLFVARGELPLGLPGPLMNDLPDVLCVFSPAAADRGGACPWQIKGRRFPRGKIREPFVAHLVFSFQGMGFWADLAQGIVYCNLQHATSDDDSAAAVVDFGFIELPPGCQLNLEKTLRLWDDPKNLTRTMCCVRDSIWFVCIDQAATEVAK